MILIVTEIITLAQGNNTAKGRSDAVGLQVKMVAAPGATDVEMDIAKLVLAKIGEAQDQLAEIATESQTLDGKRAIDKFGQAAVDRFIKAVK